MSAAKSAGTALAEPCEHVWGAWSTERRAINDGTDPVYYFERVCYVCGERETSDPK